MEDTEKHPNKGIRRPLTEFDIFKSILIGKKYEIIQKKDERESGIIEYRETLSEKELKSFDKIANETNKIYDFFISILEKWINFSYLKNIECSDEEIAEFIEKSTDKEIETIKNEEDKETAQKIFKIKFKAFKRKEIFRECYNTIKNYNANNEDVERAKAEILEFYERLFLKKELITAEQYKSTEGDSQNTSKKQYTEIMPTVKSDSFQISTERIINNLNKKEYETKYQINSQKYFYIFDLNLKNDKSKPYIFDKSDFLSMEDTYFLNGVNTLYSIAKQKKILFRVDSGDGQINTFYGFFLVDLYNLLNGTKQKNKISDSDLESLRKELYKLSCIWLSISKKRQDGKELKETNEKEKFYINEIKSQLLYFKIHYIKRESDHRDKEDPDDDRKIEFISFFEEPILLQIRDLENTVTRVDNRLMKFKQPNRNSREINFYLIRAIELLKSQGQNKISFETIKMALSKEIKDKYEQRDLKNLIKKRLETFKKLNYIKGYELKKDYILLEFNTKKSIK